MVNVVPLVLNFPRDYYLCGEGGTSVELTASGGTTYLWTPGTTLDDSTIANPISTPYITTTYTVTVSNSTCFDTAHVTVHLMPSPSAPLITKNGDTLSVPQIYASYQWYKDGSPLPGDTSYFYVPTQTGYYSVLVTDSYGCRVITASTYIVILSLPSISATEKGIWISPNPASNQFTVYSLRVTADKTLAVFNVLGERVYSDSFNGKEKTVSYKLSTGIYFVMVQDGEKQFIQKLVIQ